MREIKFRAWDVTGGYYTPIECIAGFILNVSDTVLSLDGYKYEDEYIIEQYTGLKDKNGKEIYEGDIVTSPFDIFAKKFTYYISYGEYIVNDVYDCGETNVVGYHGVNGNDHFLLDDGDFLEVIGNIHENPELLK